MCFSDFLHLFLRFPKRSGIEEKDADVRKSVSFVFQIAQKEFRMISVSNLLANTSTAITHQNEVVLVFSKTGLAAIEALKQFHRAQNSRDIKGMESALKQLDRDDFEKPLEMLFITAARFGQYLRQAKNSYNKIKRIVERPAKLVKRAEENRQRNASRRKQGNLR